MAETKRTRRTAAELIEHHERQAAELKVRPLKQRAPKAKAVAEEIAALAEHAGETAIDEIARELAVALEAFIAQHAEAETTERSLQS